MAKSKSTLIVAQKHTLDFEKLFRGLAKAAWQYLYEGKKVEALKSAFESITLKAVKLTAGELADQLVNRALISATLELLDTVKSDLSHFQDASKKSMTESINDFIGKSSEAIELKPDFYESLSDSKRITEFTLHLNVWLIDQAGFKGVPEAITNRLRSYIADAMAKEYEKNASAYAPLDQYLSSRFRNYYSAEYAWERSKDLFFKRLNQPLFGEPYALPSVFVEPRAYYVERKKNDDAKVAAKHSEYIEIKHAIKLFDTLTNWLANTDKTDAIKFVTGPLGSGKSSTTRVWLAERMKHTSWRCLFVPIHELEEGSFRQALENYGKTTGTPEGIFDEATAPRQLLIVLDGLDELANQGEGGKTAAEVFVDQVQKIVGQRNISELRLKVLLCGRPITIQQIENDFRESERILHLLPYSVEDVDSFHENTRELIKNDLRLEWWKRFALVTYRIETQIPHEFSKPVYHEVTSLPLLCHLICMAKKDDSLQAENEEFNLANVYDHLIKSVYRRDWGRHTAIKTDYTALQSDNHEPIQGHPQLTLFENYEVFRSLLSLMGLAAWHEGSGRGAKFSALQTLCVERGQSEQLDPFRPNAESSGRADRLFVNFFFSRGGVTRALDPTFEFTHKSFGEYLTAVCLVEHVEEYSARWKKRKSPESKIQTSVHTTEEILLDWLKLTGSGTITAEVYRFICEVMKLRITKDNELVSKWRMMLVELINESVNHGMPAHELTHLKFQQMSAHGSRANHALLCLLGACVPETPNFEEMKNDSECEWSNQYQKWKEEFLNWKNQIQIQINWPSKTTAADWMRVIRKNVDFISIRIDPLPIKAFDFSGYDLHSCDLRGADLRGADLKDADLRGADFREADLSMANLQGADLNRADFREADLSMANLQRADLNRADFREADLSGTNLSETDLSRTALSEVDLSGADLSEVYLSRADLSEANLSEADLSGADLSEADLSGADLSGADLSRANLTDANLSRANLRSAIYGNIKLNTLEGRELLKSKGAIVK